jgi:hypothetical protein|tara:strand:+ start:659 stop:841 length:183 start_codon:yes stop_codon:yes gene_type:complete
MAKGVKHYFKNGTQHKGGVHKHPDGTLMTGKVMSNTSKKLYHYGQLLGKARQKAKTSWSK